MKRFLTTLMALFVVAISANTAMAANPMSEDATFTILRTGDLRLGTSGSATALQVIIPWVNLGNAFIDGTGPITSTTTPNWTTFGNVSGITWDDSTETTKVQFSGLWPNQCASAMTLNILIGGNADIAVGEMIADWQVWINGDGVAYDAAAVAQTAGTSTTQDIDGSPELLALSLNSTALSALSGGENVTIDVFNASATAGTTGLLIVQDISATCSY